MHEVGNRRIFSEWLLLARSLGGCYPLHNISTHVGTYTVKQDRCDLICIDAPRAEAIRWRLLGEGEDLDAAERARALSDPTRLTLAEALRKCEEAVRVRPLVDRGALAEPRLVPSQGAALSWPRALAQGR